ncbi:MAG: phosphotransferase family protein [Rhizobacter sp.]|nr:phosphotransferase family protein [Rhizobacter sp.]
MAQHEVGLNTLTAMNALSVFDDLQQGLSELAVQLWPHAGEISGLKRLSGGASQETWAFDTHCPEGLSPMILRRAPPGSSARNNASVGLDTEAALIQLAEIAGVLVPKVHAVLRPSNALGVGFIMERVEGEALGRRIVRDPSLAKARQRLARQCGQALARIHHIPIGGLPPLRPAPATVELAQYLGQHRTHGTAKPVFEIAFQWLARHAAGAPIKPTLVHGDFRNGNLMVGEDGLRAVLDWELAHLGDPMEDLGWMCVNSWRYGCDELPVGGFGTREELFAGYEDAGGRVDVDRVRYWEVFGTLKWGVICEAMAHSYLTGAELNVEKAAIGRRASEADIDLLNLLAPRSASARSVARSTSGGY